MKRVILILVMVLGVLTLKAQVIQQDSTNLVTVKDSTFIQDARLNYMIQTIYPAIKNFVDDYNRQVKLAGDSLTYKAETNQLIRKFKKAVNEYATAFMIVKDIQVDSAAIVKEFSDLNTKIEALQKDPEIKYIEAMSEFKRIQNRQQVLARYYQQILAKP